MGTVKVRDSESKGRRGAEAEQRVRDQRSAAESRGLYIEYSKSKSERLKIRE